MSALIEQYSSANRVVESDLAIKYTKTRVYGQWSYASGTSITTLYEAWSYTRTAMKSYKYVGMTKTAADECATAMRSKYQRATMASVWDPDGAGSEFTDQSSGNAPMADVSVQLVNGQMYNVVINVSETDSRMRMASVSPASLFSAENQRDYDTGD